MAETSNIVYLQRIEEQRARRQRPHEDLLHFFREAAET